MLRNIMVGLFALILTPVLASAEGWDPRVKEEHTAKAQERIEAANKTVAAFLAMDPSLQAYFDEAYGYAVFPKVRKGAVGIGGARGSGILFEGGKPALRAFLMQYTIGFQMGGKTYSEIIFFRDKEAYTRFEYGELAFSKNATAVSIDSRGVVQTSYADDVAVVVTGGDGLMFEASIGGQNFSTRPLD